MFTRWSISVLTGLLMVNHLWGQNGIALTEAPLEKACFKNEVTLDLTGEITFNQNGKTRKHSTTAKATHVFYERNLDINGPVVDKAARHYLSAESTIRFNNEEAVTHTLRPACAQLVVAHRVKDQLITYTPTSKLLLTRDEVDLLDHFDTLTVSGLAPGKTVEVGHSWKLANHVVSGLCNLSRLSKQNVECTLTSVKGPIAHGKIVGNVEGIDMGAQVTTIINGRFEFDTSEKRVVLVEWKQEDERKQGPISPAMTVKATVKLKRAPIPEPNQLNRYVIVPIPTDKTPPRDMTNIRHEDMRKRFKLRYSRDWHVTSPDDSLQLVMRLMDNERGDFVAQVTITPLPEKIELKNVRTLDTFVKQMGETLGWVEQGLIEKSRALTEEEKAKHHHLVYRHAASGELDGVKTWQYFYLIVSPQGQQMLVTFSVVPQHVSRMGARDLELLRDIEFP